MVRGDVGAVKAAVDAGSAVAVKVGYIYTYYTTTSFQMLKKFYQ
jgi:microcompartment protein CcmL/EutN